MKRQCRALQSPVILSEAKRSRRIPQSYLQVFATGFLDSARNDSAILLRRGRLMPAFSELFDHFLIERRNVIRLATRNEPVIHDDLLIDPARISIAHIDLDRRPRRSSVPEPDRR